MTRPLRPFTPSKEDAAALDARTVGRDEILAVLDRRLRSLATSRNRPHTLLIGPRGSGKSHVIEVALHRAAAEPEFGKRVAAVRLDEDLVGVHRYRDVLRLVHQRLTGTASTAVTEAMIAEALGPRRLLLVVENLDRLFRTLGRAGQQDLRSWVENSRAIMLLASAPLLFDGVQDRDLPWFGGLAIAHLDELSLEDGSALLEHIARERDDTELADFVASERGSARLKVINQLAGGSPRVWMILSECVTVEMLDELMPAVEGLMEGLVPYYQQLLWDLAPNEQALVATLADGPVQRMTVSELAAAAELDQRTVATTLGRLAENRWVRGTKQPGVDGRTTWYELREPLLRHHFHYRSAGDQPLPLIVDLLRAWFDPEARRHHLLAATPESPSLRLLAASLIHEPHHFDSAYAERDVDDLLVDARRWAEGGDAATRTRDAGVVIEWIIALARGEVASPEPIASVTPDALASTVAVVSSAAGDEATTVGAGLDQLANCTIGRTRNVLELVAASWNAGAAPWRAIDRFEIALARFDDETDPLALDLRHELAHWTGKAGAPSIARELLTVVVADRTAAGGAGHPDTLVARSNLASWTGHAGYSEAARDQYAAIIDEHARSVGADHVDTLFSRSNYAHWVGSAGDAAAARDQYRELVSDLIRVCGADHRYTLVARGNLAHWTGVGGDADAARDLLCDLVRDIEGVLGPDHEDTFALRQGRVYWTGQAGDAPAAQSLARSLLTDLELSLGADHEHTLTARYNFALWTRESGDAGAARSLFRRLVADRTRVSGADHPDTFIARQSFGITIGTFGEPSRASALLASLAQDLARVFGPESEKTVRATTDSLRWLAVAGQPAAAIQRLLAIGGSRERLAPAVDEAVRAFVRSSQMGDDDDDPIDPDGPAAELLTTIRLAVQGDAEALARVPQELLPLITDDETSDS